MRLLKKDGRWINFGSLAFSRHPNEPADYSPEETKAIVAENRLFGDPYVSQATIPYMSSPASRHGRQEKRVHVSRHGKKREAPTSQTRHRALPDWIVVGKEPGAAISPAFRTQAMTTQIYSFMMSLIDGKRSASRTWPRSCSSRKPDEQAKKPCRRSGHVLDQDVRRRSERSQGF